MNDDALYRAFWTPCESRAHLRAWILKFMEVDLPGGIVCDDEIHAEPTNSSPLDFVWEIYHKAMEGTDWNFDRILAYAARDSYKCVKKGTRILTKARGLVPIEDISIGEVIWSGKNWRPVSNWIHDGVKDSVTARLANGIKLTTSPIHRIWTWTDGTPNWKKVSLLKSGDLVAIDTTSGFQSEVIDRVPYEEGYVLGILAGDGCLTQALKTNSVTLSSSDPFILDAWRCYCLRIAGRPPSQSRTRIYDWSVSSVAVVRDLKRLGSSFSYAHEKFVPEVCFRDRSMMSGFLSGLLDTDGSFSKNGNLILSLTSPELIRGTQLMLTALGINASIRKNARKYGKQNHEVWSLFVGKGELQKFGAAGIRINAQKANSSAASVSFGNVHDSVPAGLLRPLLDKLSAKGGRWNNRPLKPRIGKYSAISRAKAIKLVAWGKESGDLTLAESVRWNKILATRWVAVVEVVKGGDDFYDLTVEGDHSYWSNGIISHNTLSFSILEVLAIFHMRRSVAHMAAQEDQAKKCASYVEKFLNMPIFREYVSGNNKRTLEVCWYETPDRQIKYPWPVFEQLVKKGTLRLDDFLRKKYYVKIIIASMKGANSEHVPFLCLDELDLAPRKPYDEALSIPCPSEDGAPPIVIMTSTRKTAFGIVQKEIDDAAETGLHIRHWNIIDVSKSCPPERYLPEEPKINLFYSTDTLRVIQQEDHERLSPEEQDRWFRAEGYQGCIQNCKLFASCRGRLATKQLGTSKLLKDIREVTNTFKKRAKDPEYAKAQLLCWKPGSVGLIYPLLSPDIHLKTISEMATMISGNEYGDDFTKTQLVEVMRAAGVKFFAGMDFGYTHAFAVVLGALWGQTMYIFEVISVTEFELGQKLELCKRVVQPFDPLIYPDPAYPSDIKSFRRAGFRMVEFKKNVLEGISAVRAKIMPTLKGVPEMYFLAGDPGVEVLFNRLRQYHWLLDAAGNPTDEPDDTDDDEADALRYLCQNLFGKKIYRRTQRTAEVQPEPSLASQAAATNKKIMEQHLKILSGRTGTGDVGPTYKKGNKFFSP